MMYPNAFTFASQVENEEIQGGFPAVVFFFFTLRRTKTHVQLLPSTNHRKCHINPAWCFLLFTITPFNLYLSFPAFSPAFFSCYFASDKMDYISAFALKYLSSLVFGTAEASFM